MTYVEFFFFWQETYVEFGRTVMTVAVDESNGYKTNQSLGATDQTKIIKNSLGA